LTAQRIDRKLHLRGLRAACPFAFLSLFGAVVALVLSALGAQPSQAVEVPSSKFLLSPTPQLPADGLYLAGDLMFMVTHLAGQVRLRFTDKDEIFYLVSEPASLGGRVLKYDTGEVALQVAGWGGITLYTEDARSGVPAERTGDAADFAPKPVAAKDLMPLAAQLAQELTAAYDFAIGFNADWDTLAQGDTVRGLAVDAMRNAAYAIAQVAKTAKRGAIAEGLHIVKVAAAARPGVNVQRGVLTISYAPQGGPSARPSSLAIARALEAAL
jgi:hypothetical protein